MKGCNKIQDMWDPTPMRVVAKPGNTVYKVQDADGQGKCRVVNRAEIREDPGVVQDTVKSESITQPATHPTRILEDSVTQNPNPPCISQGTDVSRAGSATQGGTSNSKETADGTSNAKETADGLKEGKLPGRPEGSKVLPNQHGRKPQHPYDVVQGVQQGNTLTHTIFQDLLFQVQRLWKWM